MPLALDGPDVREWVAFALAIGAFVFSWFAFKRAGRAEQRAERADHRDEARFAREREEAEAVGRARLIVTHDDTRGLRPRGEPWRCYLAVRNAGQASARGVRVWLRKEDVLLEDVDVFVSGDARREEGGGELVLVPGGEPVPVYIDVSARYIPQIVGLGSPWFVVWLAWEDDAGRHEEPAGVDVRAEHSRP